MSSVTGIPQEPRKWTIGDLERLPDDGRRYELLDGELLVSPAQPVKQHVMCAELAVLLRAACPPDLYVLSAPVAWQPDALTSFQPDVLVVPKSDLDGKNIQESIPLAVEVLSPSTRHRDLVSKRAKYESAGVGSYWAVDPEVPSVLALELRDGRYQVAGEVQQDEELQLRRPFPVTLTPSALLAPYR